MMKHVLACPFLMFASFTFSEGQSKTGLPKDNIKPEIEVSITPNVPAGTARIFEQDRNGNIWIAAFDGVFKYDGQSFTNIAGHLTSYRFFSVLEDRRGNLWFGSMGAGVYKYDGKSFQNFTSKEGLVNNEISCIYEDNSGDIWFGANGGASRYDGKSFRNYIMNGDSMIEDRSGKSIPDFTRPSNEVNSIIEDKTGKLWFATRGDTFVYDGKTFSVFTDSGRPSNVRCIIEDSKGNIWLGGDGLWRFNGRTSTNFSKNPVLYICEDKAGNIWTSSQERDAWLLLRYDARSLSDGNPTVTEVSSHPIIWSIFQANDGSIWYGAVGVHRYDGNTTTHFKSREARY
ncbi:MAG TPA: two-component regulator propeller domain-containing protein [Chryseolinea sp.]|nr:two-component regulator propeller domain-containing protein [Chryseolinea sp.]